MNAATLLALAAMLQEAPSAPQTPDSSIRTDTSGVPATRTMLSRSLLLRLPIDDPREALILVPGVVRRGTAFGIGAGDGLSLRCGVFSKHKHVVKEKGSVRREVYTDVRSEPFVAHATAEYSGVYQVEGLGDVIQFQIGSDGTIQAAGHDSEPSRSFVLETPESKQRCSRSRRCTATEPRSRSRGRS